MIIITTTAVQLISVNTSAMLQIVTMLDFEECANEEINVEQPICCASFRGCAFVSNITTTIGDIRCDARRSCDDIAGLGLVFSQEKGSNMYFSGSVACQTTNATIRGFRNNKHSVIATGSYAVSGMNIKNVDVICAAFQSISNCVIENIVDSIFVYGVSGALNAIITSIGDIYCSAAWAVKIH